MADNYDKALTAILIGNNIVNILMSSLGTLVATRMFGNSGVAIATAVITVAVLIFGEILPKSFAKNKSEKCSYAFAPPLLVWTKLMTPFVAFFNLISKAFSSSDEPSVTEDELKSMIEEIEEQGVLEEHESDLVRSALEFDETTIKEICIPRVQIVGVERRQSPEEVQKVFLEQNFSRLPVYEKNKDNIVGIITYKDFFRMKYSGTDTEDPIGSILQNIIRISELQTVSEAFKKMQEEKMHLAVVLDQYGGTRGLVTLEDIIEELVGEIYDESDVETADVTKIRESMYRVSGTMRTSDLLEQLGIEDRTAAESNAVTVGGFVIELLGHIPKSGEGVKCGVMRFRVIEVSDHSVKMLLLKIDQSAEEQS